MPFNYIRTFLQTISSPFSRKKPSTKARTASSTSYKSPSTTKRPAEPRPAQNRTTQSAGKNEAPVSKPVQETAQSTKADHHQLPNAKVTSPSTPQKSVSSADRRFYITPAGTISTSPSFLCLDCIPEPPNIDHFESFIEIELGIDFGTKFTKVCFRDTDSERTEIVTFTNDRTSIEQAFILSRVEISKHNDVISGLTEKEWQDREYSEGKSIDFLKMRLAYLDGPSPEKDWLPSIGDFDTEASIENLSAYFLSSVIVRSQNWLRVRHPDLFQGRSVRWILNIGAPVAYWEGPAISRFKHVLKMAWALSCTPTINTSSCLTLEQLNICVGQVRQWMSQNPEYPFDGYVKPEIAAAVWSYIQATGSKEGFSIFFDIGDGTAEGAAFRYYKKLGEAKIDFYSGSVEPLGVSALAKKLEKELQISEGDIRDYLVTRSNLEQGEKIDDSQTRKSFHQLVAAAVVDGCTKHSEIRQYQASDDIGSNLEIFLGGGGANILFYRATVQETHTKFNHASIDVPPYRLKPVPQPKDLEMNKLHTGVFNRFAIAYGLSMPEGESPTFDFPQLSDSGAVITAAAGSISYEDSKDSC
jgi:hypothetical protein